MNMEALFRITEGWNTFKRNHPKFPMFLNAVSKTGIKEGTIVAISVTDPDGRVMDTNIKVTQEDIALFQSLKEMGLNRQ